MMKILDYFCPIKLKDFQCFCCGSSMHYSVVCEDEKQAVAVKSQLQQLARPMYSNPPVHGALVVSTILGDPNLKNLWLGEVKVSSWWCCGCSLAWYSFSEPHMFSVKLQ